MLLDDPPHEIISTLTRAFKTDTDIAAFSRINDSLRTLQSSRQHRLSTQRAQLKSLNRQISTLQSTHALTVQSHNPTEHASEILRLDTEKFRIAKEASGLEMEEERLTGDLDRTRGQLEEVEAAGVEGAAARRGEDGMDDEILLKLKVYRNLGIDVEMDKDTGLYTKAVMRNTQKGDVHVVNVDPKFSRYFYANYFWNTV